MTNSNKKVATIVVVGDIGRSPRMSYHVTSLLEHNYFVNIVGYLETKPIKEITEASDVSIETMSQAASMNMSGVLLYCWKAFWIFCTLSWALFKCLVLRKSDVLICQNPPAVPGLIVCYFMCLFSRTRFIVDFHNYTYSILSLTNHPDNILVKIAKFLETSIGRLSYANFCVTNAMKQDLEERFKVKAVVLYDRPPQQFKPVTLKQKHDLFLKLGETYAELKGDKNSTPFTECNENNIISLKLNRSALLVSSTSWTPDEDFGILLAALEKYEQKANIFTGYPDLVCVITGKGPLKNDYAQIIKKKEFVKVKIIMPWLEAEDYPVMLGSADLGVCLHYSSSGLDLPMKVVDMFGCGLPVCAIDFKCLNELVRNKETGFVFKNEDELAEQLLDWFHNFPNNTKTLQIKQTIDTNLKKFQELRWQENWNTIAWPIIEP